MFYVKIRISILKKTQYDFKKNHIVQILKFWWIYMKHYEKLLEKGCFSREELIELVGTPAAAKMVIYEYQKRDTLKE